MTQTASTTNLTMGAGFFMVLTTVTSAGLRVSRALTADWRAGMASAKSFSQSSRMAYTSGKRPGRGKSVGERMIFSEKIINGSVQVPVQLQPPRLQGPRHRQLSLSLPQPE